MSSSRLQKARQGLAPGRQQRLHLRDERRLIEPGDAVQVHDAVVFYLARPAAGRVESPR